MDGGTKRSKRLENVGAQKILQRQTNDTQHQHLMLSSQEHRLRYIAATTLVVGWLAGLQ